MPTLATTRHAPLLMLAALLACVKDAAPPKTEAPADFTMPAPSPPALSRFSVPLEYDVTAVLRLVDSIVPRTFGSMDERRTVNGDSRKHYAFEATRGPFTAFASGSEMHLRATFAYQARGFYKPPIGPTLSAGCGNEAQRPRIVVELATPLRLSPDWHLVSHARLVTIRPATTRNRDRCDVSFLNIDVTDRVMDAARPALAGKLPDIDRKVGTVDLTGRVTEWWGLLNKPIRLTDDVWLTLQPQQLRIGDVSGEAKVLTVPVTLDARPRIITGPEPQVVASPLPPLAKDTVAEGFRIEMDGLVDYATATAAVTQALAGREFARAGRSVTVADVSVRPASRGRLLLGVAFVGDASGRLQLIGTPRYRAADGIVDVPDLDFDLDTDSKLVSAYAWLRSDELRETIREKARVPIEPALAKGRELLLGGLNRKLGDAVKLSATVDSVAVKGIYVTRDALVARAEATGQARVAVKQR